MTTEYPTAVDTSSADNTPDHITANATNTGKPWTTAEEKMLVEELESGINLGAIAVLHGRKNRSIEYRIAKILAEYKAIGKDTVGFAVKWNFNTEKQQELIGDYYKNRPWGDSELDQLLGELEGLTIPDIAKIHNRSIESVKEAVCKLTIDKNMPDNKIKLDQWQLSADEYAEMKSKIEKKVYSKSKTRWSNEEVVQLVTELNNNIAISKIAANHERSEQGIKGAIYKELRRRQSKGDDVKPLIKKWQVSDKQYTRYCTKMQGK